MGNIDNSQSQDFLRKQNDNGEPKTTVEEKSTGTTEDKIIDNSVNDQGMEVQIKHEGKEGKKIRYYIYEFFMLFLAVTAGFFVENIREKKSEHHREVQYIKSLINDVKLDTAQLAQIITYDRDQLRGLDTLLKELEKPNSKRVVNCLYHYSYNYLLSYYLFMHTDRTITQLKNAGGLRLIQSKAASDSIINYYSVVSGVEFNGEFCQQLLFELSKQQKELLDYKVFSNKNLKDLLIDPTLKLLSRDPHKIDLYYNETFYYTGSLGSYSNKLVRLKEQATQLLQTLQKEYNEE